MTTAEAGGTIECACGRELEVPSLRQLRDLAPENLLAETFGNPVYWANRGCFLCGSKIGVNPFPLIFELQQAEYKQLPIEVAPVAFLGIVFGLGRALRSVAEQSREQILVKEPKSLAVMVGLCPACAASEGVVRKCFAQLASEKYGQELYEDYPNLRVYSPNCR